jgi:hypothetical protein
LAINYPVSVDNGTSIPTPTGVNTQNNPDHASLHTLKQQAIIALETKLGTGSTAPASNTLLLGTGAGTSAWSQATSAQLRASISDETGTGSAVFATSPTLVTPAVDTINESTPGNGTTVGGVNMKSGALTTSSSVPTAAIADSAVTSAKVATGIVVQVVGTNYSAVASGTTVIPEDDTIPQITEGVEFMTQAITPKSATNILIIESSLLLASSVGNQLVGALFQDAAVNALAVGIQYQATANGMNVVKTKHTMVAGTTSSTTFRIRGGGSAAGTWTMNGFAAGRKYGGVTLSNITITEYKA